MMEMLKKIRHMVRVLLLFQMAQNMRENFQKIKFMVRENIQIQMEIFLKENLDLENFQKK